MQRSPFGFSQLLGVLDFHLQRPTQIVLVGDASAPETRQLLAASTPCICPIRRRVSGPAKLADGKGPAGLDSKVQVDGKPDHVCVSQLYLFAAGNRLGNIKALLLD